MDLVEKISSPSSEAEKAVTPEAPAKLEVPSRGMPWSFPVAVFGGVALLLFVFLGQFASLVRTQYKIVGLKDRQRNLEREKIDLQLQIQQLTSLERIERIASGRLQMAPPANRQIVDVGLASTQSKIAQDDPESLEPKPEKSPKDKKILQ